MNATAIGIEGERGMATGDVGSVACETVLSLFNIRRPLFDADPVLSEQPLESRNRLIVGEVVRGQVYAELLLQRPDQINLIQRIPRIHRVRGKSIAHFI